MRRAGPADAEVVAHELAELRDVAVHHGELRPALAREERGERGGLLGGELVVGGVADDIGDELGVVHHRGANAPFASGAESGPGTLRRLKISLNERFTRCTLVKRAEVKP